MPGYKSKFTFTQLNIINSTLEHKVEPFSEVITTAVCFYKSSFESFNVYCKQTIKF